MKATEYEAMAKTRFEHKAVYLVLTLLAVPVSHAQMIRSNALQQDTAKLNLCIDRARHGPIRDQDLVPFEIDARYLARARKDNPDATFFAIPGSLYECEVAGNGLYGPGLAYGENWFWHVIRPPSFQPPINTVAGSQLAANTCLKDVPRHADLPEFDHAGYFGAQDIGYMSPRAMAKPTRPTVAGVPVSSYDVEVTGVAYFKTSGIDLLMLQYACLYSPMLELKAVGWRRDTPGPRVWLKSARQAAAQSHR
jgi:hypothetical protein